MTTIQALIGKRLILTYLALTFGISWGGFVLVMGPAGFPASKGRFEALFPLACLAMLAGPSLSGILLTAIVDGKAGLRELLSRLLRRRVACRWYAIALLTAPLLMSAILLTLSLFSPGFLPGIFATGAKGSLMAFGLAVGFAAGIFEELGWTGFAIPRLRKRFGVWATGLIMGLIWAVWHELAAFWASGTSSGSPSLAGFLLDPILLLVVFRILMVWVYDHTESLFVAMLMHASLTASVRILSPLAVTGGLLLTLDLTWAAALWIVVGAIALSTARSSRVERWEYHQGEAS
jgi:uncharacterized protein